jgi:hypothetical protein
MPRKKKIRRRRMADSDDASVLTHSFFDRAEVRKGDKVVRRGRPPLPNPNRR